MLGSRVDATHRRGYGDGAIPMEGRRRRADRERVSGGRGLSRDPTTQRKTHPRDRARRRRSDLCASAGSCGGIDGDRAQR
uniref:Uncharacterized protein n=1 Tax=uncultured marine virus TaxID=186617 RepID=A0A0F7L206_9VIRU|nr:hypothetical protein [uncultured marine virus]